MVFVSAFHKKKTRKSISTCIFIVEIDDYCGNNMWFVQFYFSKQQKEFMSIDSVIVLS